MVDELGYNVDSASWNQQIDSLEVFSGSTNVSISNLNQSSASQQVSINNINAFTASAIGLSTGSLLVTASAVSNVITFTKGNGSTFNVTVADTTDLSQLNQATASLQAYTASANIKFANLDSTTASLNSSITQLNANTASQQVSINNLNTTTASLLVETQNLELFSASALISITNLNQSSASQQTQINSLIAATGSYATTGSNTFVGANTFTSISASSFISASEFVGNGSKITGITASISMPILDEGIPQGNAVSLNFTGSGISAFIAGGTAIISVNTPDSGTVNNLTASFNAYTSSTNLDLAAIHQATASLQQFTASFNSSTFVGTASFNSYTSSNNQRVSSLETNSASVNISVTNLNSFSSSVLTQLNTLANVTSSLISKTGSYATTGSNTFVGDQTINGNITAFSASFTYLQTTYETASVIYSSGSNIFGDATNDTQTLNGTVIVSGSQQITGSLGITGNITMVNGTDLITHHVRAQGSNGLELQTSAGTIIVAMGQGGGTQAGFVGALSANSFSSSTINGLGDPLAFSTSVDSRLDSLEGVSGSFTTTASFNSYTSSNDQKVNSLISATGSYATTGSNTFTGDQTLIDAAGNRITLADVSGSLMLVGSPYTSSSLHISASNSGSTNLIFKFNDITSDTIISGSGNIFSNQTANTTGFKRYIGGNNNIFSGVASVPQISGSMQFSPTFATNYLAGNMTMRGPVSSSAWVFSQNNILGTLNIGSSAANNAEKLTAGLTLNGNYIAGTLSIIANNTALTGSSTTLQSNNINGTATLNLNTSAATFNGNSINDGAFVLNNTYFSSSAGLGAVTIQRNTIAGNTNTFSITGSIQTGLGLTGQPQFNDNLVGGANNTIFSNYSNSRTSGVQTYGNFHRSIVYGNTLIVTASMSAGEANTQGSAFFGRYNVDDSIRNKADYTVFAVGTGNSTTRKTGFLIDSGSNSFFEGSLNVSGSTTITGSLILSSSNATELFVIGDTQFTGSLIMSSSNAVELTVIGNMVVTGSAFGNVVSMSITSNTASMDLNLGNYFTLTLADTATTHISASNVQPGTSATLVITTGTNSSASLAPTMLQPSGSAYSATNGSAKKDVLSIVAVASGIPFVVSTKNMI
jgi:hypothetical protein